MIGCLFMGYNGRAYSRSASQRYISTLLLSILTISLHQTSFASDDVNTRLVFANRVDIRIITDHIQSTNSSKLLSGLSDAAALDFLYSTNEGVDNSTFCWTDVKNESIHCANMSNLNHPKALITSGLISPDGLAIDWITNKLYWIDSETKKIEVCELFTGNNRKVLFWSNHDQPRGVALDPRNRYMYWTDWGDNPKIERAGMNGDPASRKVLVTENIKWPNGITIDYSEDRLYWVDASLSYIHSINLDGTNRRYVKDGQLLHPFSITVYNNLLYWTDWKNRSIYSCEKNDCSTLRLVQTNLNFPMDIVVYEPSRQPRDFENPCSVNNGGCSHLCLLAPAGSNNCACSTGIRLKADNKTCENQPSAMIFLARRFDLRMISLDTPDFTDVVIEIPDRSKSYAAVAIDYDPVSGYVYWTDDEVRLIQRVFRNGTNQQTIVSAEVMNPDGIAVDWVAGNIFWTDTGTDRIEVARLDGSNRRVIVSSDVDEPRAIQLDPVYGWIYWTDWGKPPKIERCAMDGSQRSVIIGEHVHWPNGIALDVEQNKMYWADAKRDTIERANLDGTNREVVYDSQIPHVFGFSILGEYLYWTDWQSRTIERINKNTGENRVTIIEKLTDLMSIKTVNLTVDRNITNPCAVNDGGCSHLCLMTPNGHVCSCPMSMELKPDNKTCVPLDAFLIFSQKQDKLIRTSIQYSNSKDTEIPIKNLMNISGLDFHFRKSQLYFSDFGNKSIRYCWLNGSSVQLALEFTREHPVALTVDWLSSNLYFIDKTLSRIEVYNPITRARRVVIWLKIVDPRFLAIHPTKGYIFWADWVVPSSKQPQAWIGRANLDGTDQKYILPHVGRAGSLTIDFTNDRLYWIDFNNNSIISSDLDGREKRTFMPNLTMPYSLTIYNNSIYWYDLREECIKRMAIDTNEKREVVVVQSSLQIVDILHAYDSSRQPGWSGCASDNGGCQYLCFTSGEDQTKTTCSCPTHYSLNTDGKTCSAPRNFILIVERVSQYGKEMQMKRILEPHEPSFILPLKSLKSVRSPTFDLINDKIYWIQDGKNTNIKWSQLNSFQSGSYLDNGIFSPHSLVFDPFSQLIYWSDSVRNVINVTRSTGEPVGVIVDRNVGLKPRLLAILPNKGSLFFSNENSTGRQTFYEIIRSNLVGDHQTVIVTNRTEIHSLIIDNEGGQLYWAEHMSIYSCDSNGTGIKTLIRDVRVTSITVFKNNLYYVVSPHDVNYVNKITGRGNNTSGGPTHLIVDRSDMEILDFFSVDENLYQTSNPCAENNGDCSHICYINENSRKQCGCPSGLVLDHTYQSCEPMPTCRPVDFTCLSGQVMCIPHEWRCDGALECSDGSDEKNCPTGCSAKQFQCRGGECIDRSRYCNHVADCYDSSDEPPGKCCSNDQFLCLPELKCISLKLVGNGRADCSDGSDENSAGGGGLSASDDSKSAASDPYAVGIIVVLCIVSIFIIVIIAFIVWKCHRRSLTQSYINNQNIMMGLQHQLVLSSTGSGNSLQRRAGLAASVTGTTLLSDITPSSSALPYDRNHVTGASSSSSSVTQIQAPGFNPPPSPVTERSARISRRIPNADDDTSTVASSSIYAPYRPTWPRGMPVPPTTPISTCDDSDHSVVDFSTSHKSRTRRKSNKRYQLLTGTLPPAPTPSRTSTLRITTIPDENEHAPPPSPTTVLSYTSSTSRRNHNPYPPPPSPEPNDDS